MSRVPLYLVRSDTDTAIFVASANVKDNNRCALLKRERHLQRIFVALVRQMHRAIDVLQ